MSIYEYNEERVMKFIREDEYTKGKNDGRIEGKAEILLDLFSIHKAYGLERI